MTRSPRTGRVRGQQLNLGAALALLARAGAAGFARGLGAQAIQLVAVAQHREASEPERDLVLQTLDLIVLELEDQAALHADQVIVVISDDFVASLSVAELTLDGEPAVDQQLERPVHRRIAHLGLTLANLEQELVDRDVVARTQELLDDRLALRGDVEPTILHVGAPALLELAGIFGTKVRALAHADHSFPAGRRAVKRSRGSDFSWRVRYGASRWRKRSPPPPLRP